MYRNLNERSLLLVEDHTETADALYNLLKKRFKKILWAKDGLEGWHLFTQDRPDLLLVDIEMPVMNGLDLIEKIRIHNRDTHITLITAHDTKAYLKNAVTLKLDDYLVKPISKLRLHTYLTGADRYFSESGSYRYLCREYTYCYDSKTVLCDNGEQIHLTNLEIELLELLIRYSNSIVSYEMIGSKLYEEVLQNTNPIKILISKLRKKLPMVTIETVFGVGYKLLYSTKNNSSS